MEANMQRLYMGTVIGKLRGERDVHSLLVKFGGNAVGRLPIDELRGRKAASRRRRSRALRTLMVAIIFRDVDNGNIVLSEKAAIKLRRRRKQRAEQRFNGGRNDSRIQARKE